MRDEHTDDAPDRPEAAPEPGGNGDAPADGSVEDRVLEQLKNVIDPELGVNIVDLGLVYDVSIDDQTVRVEYTLTTMGCPIGPLIETQMKQLVAKVDGVEDFEAEMVFTPPWTPDKMSEEAKAALGMF